MIVVPTMHPVLLLRSGAEDDGFSKFENTVIADFTKAVRLKKQKPNWDESLLFQRDPTGRLWRLFPRVEEIRWFFERLYAAVRRYPNLVESGDLTLTLDVETTKDSPVLSQFICVGMGFRAPDDEQVVCLPFLKQYGEKYWSPEEEAEIRHMTAYAFADKNIAKLFHNKGFDEVVLFVNGLPVGGKRWCTMAAHQVLDSELPHNLGFVSALYLDSRFWKDDSKGDEGFLGLPDEQLRLYNGRDVIATQRVAPIIFAKLREAEATGTRRAQQLVAELSNMGDGGIPPGIVLMPEVPGARFWQLYQEQLAAIDVMTRGTLRGFAVDEERRTSVERDKDGKFIGLAPQLKQQREDSIAMLKVISGDDNFAPGRPAHIKKLLFNQLNMPVVATSEKTGEPSVNKEAMMLLELAATSATQRNAIKAIIQYRQADKFLGTFINGLPVSPLTKRFHPLWKLMTVSGRWASTPNAQNWPKRIKKLFRAGLGFKLVGIDLSQAEVRVMAYLSGDEELIRMYKEGINVHTVNASLLFKLKCPPEKKDHINPQTEVYLREAAEKFLGAEYDKFPTVAGKNWGHVRTLAKNFVFGCVEKGTKVAVLDGRGGVPIEEMKVGDWTWCWNGEQYEKTKVKHVVCHGIQKCVKLTLRDGANKLKTLTVTPDHPMMLHDGNFAEAGTLIVGSQLLSFTNENDGRGIATHVEQFEYVAEREVWDLEVEHPAHNFALDGSVFVGNCNYGAVAETVYTILRSKRDPETGELMFADLRLSEIEAMRIQWTKRLHPTIPAWWRGIEMQVNRLQGYACPLSGRTRWFRGGFKRNDILNMPIQSMVASLMNRCMIEIQNIFDAETGGACQIIQQVHDALTAEAPDWYAKRCGEVMQSVCSRQFQLGPYMDAVLPADPAAIAVYLDET